mmetsp:Transcript_3865/g.4451  ORF Transcript_3865/g.4451 Transcript_3865/m.4451 type:complete len:396 (+) Transcript_3865:203-1390(+)
MTSKAENLKFGGSYKVTEEVIEVQRNDGRGNWAIPASTVDGPAWFNANTGKILPGELDTVLLPAGWQWISNWKYVRTAETDLEGWSDSVDSFEQSFPSNKILYSKIRNRPVRTRKWIRTMEQKKVGSHKPTEPLEQTNRSNPFFGGSFSMEPKQNRQNKEHLTEDAYPKLLEHISSSIHTFSERLRGLEALNKVIGSQRDSADVRKNAKLNVAGLKRDKERISLLLNRLEGLEAEYANSEKGVSLSSLQMKRKKLILTMKNEALRQNQISGAIIRNMEHSKLPKKKLQSATLEKDVQAEESGEELQILSQLQLQDEIEVNDAILQESQEAVISINKELYEVKEVMQDLAMLVKDQDEGVRQIHENVENAHTKTTEAFEELQKAEELQKKGGCVIS